MIKYGEIMPYYNEIEWENLQEEKRFTSGKWNFEFPFEMPKIKHVLIKRDESYNILINIECEMNRKLPNEIKENTYTIKISDKYSSKCYVLKNCHLFEQITSVENSYGIFSLKLTVTSILFDSGVNGEVTWIKEWYLNGPHNHRIFHRTTTFSKKEIYNKELHNAVPELQNVKPFEIETNHVSSICRNYMFCKLNDEENIIISLVPDEMKPDWSNNICLQYSSKKHMDDLNLRRDIENIISFIFGRKLIKIAESRYDINGNKIKETMINPFINNKLDIKNICESSDNFPIPIYEYIRDLSEEIMSKMINSFISKKETLDFTSMFINYWSSTFLPPESKIILLAASLESLMNKWFDSVDSKRSTVIIEKSKYKQLIKDIRPLFRETFGEYAQIINKFDQLNKMSINKSMELFFEEINVEMGDIERNAIYSRNNPVHGNDMDTKTFSDIMIYSEIYRIILNRVILTLLDYNGDYILNNFVAPIPITNKLPFSLDELKNNIYEIKYYDID